MVARTRKKRTRPCGSPDANGCATSTVSCVPCAANACEKIAVVNPVMASPAAPATMSFGGAPRTRTASTSLASRADLACASES